MKSMSNPIGARIHISGIVQGVGFRPFVYGLATDLKLNGWVKNTSAGVEIEVEGSSQSIQDFTTRLRNQAPPLAIIDDFKVETCATNGYTNFAIIKSEAIPLAFQPISPDVSICDDCLNELFNPKDRRYHYPFINCTNCGPRFTIIENIPYDRPNTTMSGFDLCPECLAEYTDPLDRRFHAQPVACPNCGPHVWLEFNPQRSVPENQAITDEGNSSPESWGALTKTQQLLIAGKIIAIKGLGGFHIACDATNPLAVEELRKRKLRVDKPFAVMMPNIDTIRKHCYLGEKEVEALKSRERPILILPRRPESNIAKEIAPKQKTIGVMLPYTPMHYLLFTDWELSESSGTETLLPLVLVMTSGNLSEEPIVSSNEEAHQRLSKLVDAYLMHNRPIHIRCDDSVVRNFDANTNGKEQGVDRSSNITIIRRSRGYTPTPIKIPWKGLPLLATGAELKNTICLTRDNYAFISHHIGDMENYETLLSFEEGISHFERLFKIQPEGLAYDLHPNYLATRYALKRADQDGIPAIGVQHHHAHIASCMVEHGFSSDKPVIGVAFDGTGYGEDGAIWGGEFLIADYTNCARYAHLAYAPLPGGDLAIRKPARIALAYLWQADLDWELASAPMAFLSKQELAALESQLKKNINTPMTSSMGRLFDAVAALIDVRQEINYEAQAAIELEGLVDPHEDTAYTFEITQPDEKTRADTTPYSKLNPVKIDHMPMFMEIISDMQNRIDPGKIAARFHNGLAMMVKEICVAMRSASSINQVVLSGGVWQNMILLQKTVKLLKEADFEVKRHFAVPPNDGGLALGQAAIGSHRLKYEQ